MEVESDRVAGLAWAVTLGQIMGDSQGVKQQA